MTVHSAVHFSFRHVSVH